MANVSVIQHSNHHHVLTFESAKKPYNCNGCRQLGFGPSYECKYCNFHLHPECALLCPPPAFHQFCKGCEFVFHKEPQCHRSFCDACGKDVQGFSYRCKHRKPHYLHPCCLKLPLIITGHDGIHLRLTHKVSSKCVKCKSKKASNGIKGWCYVSDSGGFHYHVACVKDLVLESFKNGCVLGNAGLNAPAGNPVVPISSSTAIVPKSNRSFFSRFIKKVTKTVLIKLIISAIFGDPTGLIASLVS